MQNKLNDTELNNYLAEALDRLETISDWIRFFTSMFNRQRLFFGHGLTSAYDEAVYLVLKTLELPIDNLSPFTCNRVLSGEKKMLADVFKKRVIEKLPAAYITKHACLMGYDFYIDQRAIIPRSFLAELIVNGSLDCFVKQDTPNNILDLCTGNGSVTIIANSYFYNNEIIACDISSKALEVAQININSYGLQDQIQLVQSDLFSNMGKYRNRFDLILSNPPYVDDCRMDSLTLEYLHEPQIALAGGNDGLAIINRILNQASNFLAPNGYLIIEMGDNREKFEKLYPSLFVIWLDTMDPSGFVFAVKKEDIDNYFKSSQK